MRNVKRRVTHEQFYHLTQWLGTHAEPLKKECPSYRLAAQQASVDLGFPLSTDSLEAAIAATGITWERSPHGGGLPKGKTKQLEAEIAVLRGLVHHLYRELGAKPPSGYLLPTPKDNNLHVIV